MLRRSLHKYDGNASENGNLRDDQFQGEVGVSVVDGRVAVVCAMVSEMLKSEHQSPKSV